MSYPSPLRYKITSWDQLVECRSNNDKNLRLQIARIQDPPVFSGFRIAVVHPKYGTLFAETLRSHGTEITTLERDDSMSGVPFELNTDQILQELRKFGFYVEFKSKEHLPKDILTYLLTLRKLDFDKIRVLNTFSRQIDGRLKFKWYVVGFKSCAHPCWLNNTYSAPVKEFTDGLVRGTAINISEMSAEKHFNWVSWLDYVANIDDLLRENIEELKDGN